MTEHITDRLKHNLWMVVLKNTSWWVLPRAPGKRTCKRTPRPSWP